LADIIVGTEEEDDLRAGGDHAVDEVEEDVAVVARGGVPGAVLRGIGDLHLQTAGGKERLRLAGPRVSRGVDTGAQRVTDDDQTRRLTLHRRARAARAADSSTDQHDHSGDRQCADDSGHQLASTGSGHSSS